MSNTSSTRGSSFSKGKQNNQRRLKPHTIPVGSYHLMEEDGDYDNDDEYDDENSTFCCCCRTTNRTTLFFSILMLIASLLMGYFFVAPMSAQYLITNSKISFESMEMGEPDGMKSVPVHVVAVLSDTGAYSLGTRVHNALVAI